MDSTGFSAERKTNRAGMTGVKHKAGQLRARYFSAE
jgi:hypothetical protein